MEEKIMSTDWLPGTREGQLSMARDWISVLGTKGMDWGIPADVGAALTTLADAAEGALTEAKTETSRTPVATAKCKAAFDALTDKMRDVKRRYFLVPPLTEADLVSLGLKFHDTTPTPAGAPTAQAVAETFLRGRHELGFRIVYVSGNPHDRANGGYRVWYDAIAQGETPPAKPEELRKSFFTRRKKDMIEFDFGDSGKAAYIAVQIESGSGQQGNWGPMVQAVIP
ncbi:MAG: hypothetical protein LBB77_10955 [Treponema sp.]|jgi:hypothetical protein|nr:hypothetical protein [Treponema sp.]